MLLGFCEDYQKFIVNAQHYLIPTRTSTDHNAIVRAAPTGGNPPENYRITLSRIAWMLPHVGVSDKHRMGILDALHHNALEKIFAFFFSRQNKFI